MKRGLSAFILLSGFLLLALPFQAKAEVHFASRSYVNTFIDIQDKETGFSFERRYDSACQWPSGFGMGWRTGYDTMLTWYEGTLLLHPYACAAEFAYYVTPESILELFKHGAETSDVIGLFDAPPDVEGVTVTFASANPWYKNLPQNLTLSGGVFRGDTAAMEFDGRTGFATRIGARRPIFDKDHRLLSLDNGDGTTLTFERPDERTVKAVYSRHPEAPLLYRFSEAGDLETARTIWGNTYTHTYTKKHKLTSLTWPDSTNIVLLYDPSDEWVTLYKDRDNCTEQYFYRVDRGAATMGGELVKRCPGSNEPTNHSFYRIGFKDDSLDLVTMIDQYTETTGEKFDHKTTFYDDRRRVEREVSNFYENANDLDKYRRLVLDDDSPLAKSPVIYYLDVQDANRSDSLVRVMIKGGKASDLKTKGGFDFYLEHLNTREKAPYRDYFKVAESFRIADSADALRESKEDGIAVVGGTVDSFRMGGVFYEIIFDRDMGATLKSDALKGEFGAKDYNDPARAKEAARVRAGLLWAGARLKVFQFLEGERVK